jgi:hypothetical protein
MSSGSGNSFNQPYTTQNGGILPSPIPSAVGGNTHLYEEAGNAIASFNGGGKRVKHKKIPKSVKKTRKTKAPKKTNKPKTPKKTNKPKTSKKTNKPKTPKKTNKPKTPKKKECQLCKFKLF